MGFLALFSGTSAQADENWSLIAPFENPESVAVSIMHSAVFVSNVSGYSKNGNGFISRLSVAGDMESLKWLTGLNAPIGLAVDGNILWAVDFDRLVKIDIAAAEIVVEFPASDENPLLNDVAVTQAGDVFVTGSASNTVYQLVGKALVPWMEDDELLAYANGIHANENEVIVAAYHLVRIDRASKRTDVLGDTEILFDLEGVKLDNTGGYFVSVIGDRPVYHLSLAGDLTALFRGKPHVADFDISCGALIAPTGANTVTSYQLPR